MRLVAILALIIGLGLAGTAVYFASERFRNLEARLAAQKQVPAVELVEVAVANADLRIGQQLKRDMVAMVKWPKAAVPKNAYTSEEALLGKPGTEPRSILRRMEPGEPILSSKVTNFGEPAGIAQRLKPGMRAFTISVNVTTGVSGFLSVGDWVDVIWTGGARGQTITKQIMERVEIIAIDQKADEERGRATVARTVTVEVSPEQVGLLTQASSSGRLTLTLRGFEDEKLTGEVTVDQSALIPAAPVREEVVEEAAPTVRIRRGTAAETAEIPVQ